MTVRSLAFAVALGLASGQPADARDPVLSLPLACSPGLDCFIQNYVDHDPGPGAADLTCGPLTYDGHDGTDFALPSRDAMAAGVSVLAAAPGTVRGLRDGMADVVYTDPGAPDISGRECGNGVLLDHGGGWQTQYCHLKRGSVTVRDGQRVGSGTVLGQVGLSGQTQFPHLHLTLRHDGTAVDPFLPSDIVQCGVDPPPGLWKLPLSYVAGGLASVGAGGAMPDSASIAAGGATVTSLPEDAPALVLWAEAFGVRAGDRLHLLLTTPQGAVLLDELAPLDRTQARAWRAVGSTADAPWPVGAYSGTVTLIRDGKPLARRSATLEVVARR